MVNFSLPSADNFIVMAKGKNIEESIGCSIDSINGITDFLKWVSEDFSRLDEYMPDTNFEKVEELFISAS